MLISFGIEILMIFVPGIVKPASELPKGGIYFIYFFTKSYRKYTQEQQRNVK